VECCGYLFTNRPLYERFDRANRQFSEAFLRKSRLARLGVHPYPNSEVYLDLFAAAGNHGLFAEALWNYFLMLNHERWTV
jgi:hypothetical protein